VDAVGLGEPAVMCWVTTGCALVLTMTGCMKNHCTAKNAAKSICTTRHEVGGDVTTCVYECRGALVEPKSEPDPDPGPELEVAR
jgi:hypothetical protein